MRKSDTLHALLYVSTLSADLPLTTVRDITRQARAKNARQDISGLLVFDGQRFCQHLEGSFKRVLDLYEKICADSRHIKIFLLQEGPVHKRKFATFSMAFADVFDVDVLCQLEGKAGLEAKAAFDTLCLSLDPQ